MGDSSSRTDKNGPTSSQVFVSSDGTLVDMLDEVIKRRLLIDGPAGEDKKFLGITKSFLGWVANNENGDNDYKEAYKRMLTNLHQIEYCHSRTTNEIQLCDQMKSDYGEVQKGIKAEIEATKDQIEQYKISLEKAKVNRRKQNEYAALSKLIKSKTDRKELERQKAVLEEELQAQKDIKKSLDDGLQQRRRNMSLLVHAIDDLNELIVEDIDMFGLAKQSVGSGVGMNTNNILNTSFITSSSSGTSSKMNPSSQLEKISPEELEENPPPSNNNNLEDISPEDLVPPLPPQPVAEIPPEIVLNQIPQLGGDGEDIDDMGHVPLADPRAVENYDDLSD